jgi:hypothetical protein
LEYGVQRSHEGLRAPQSLLTLPAGICFDLDAFVDEPIEAELCSLQGPAHRAGDDGDMLRFNVAKAVAKTRAESDTLLKTLFGQGRVMDAMVPGEVMTCLGMAYEDDCRRHGRCDFPKPLSTREGGLLTTQNREEGSPRV